LLAFPPTQLSEAAADAVVSDAGRVARLVNAVYYSLDPQVAEWFVTLLMGVVGGRPGVPGQRVAARCLRVINGGRPSMAAPLSMAWRWRSRSDPRADCAR